MIYLATLAGILMVGGLALAVSLARNMAPSNKRKRLEVQRMKDDMDKWMTQLVPIDKEELETFSLGQDKQVIRRGITTTAKGIFTTIYHEPVLAYSYRQYLGNQEKPNAILYARTAEHEYVYWLKKGKATLFIDDQEVGQISPEGTLLGKRTGKKIAQLSKDAPKMLPVTVGGREVGSLTKKDASGKKGLYERAFEFMEEDLNPKEEQLFLALAIQELVARSAAK
jgi:hypothetical protein